MLRETVIVGAVLTLLAPAVVYSIKEEYNQKQEMKAYGFMHLSKNKIKSANGTIAVLRGDEIIVESFTEYSGPGFGIPDKTFHLGTNDSNYTYFKDQIEGNARPLGKDSNLVERVEKH